MLYALFSVFLLTLKKFAAYSFWNIISRLISDMMAYHSQVCGDVYPRFPEIKHLSHPTCIVCLCGSHGCWRSLWNYNELINFFDYRACKWCVLSDVSDMMACGPQS